MLDDLLAPPWAKIAAVLLVASAAFAGGIALEAELKEGDIATLKLQHTQALAAADQAKDAAEEKARLAEVKAAQDLAALSEQYVKEQDHEKAAVDQRVADLLSDNVRLRVAIQYPAGGSCPLPGAAATAAAGNGQETATLGSRVAGRLARRYADYNAIVDQLSLCQATIETYRAMRPVQ